jgi:hypothetical protein
VLWILWVDLKNWCRTSVNYLSSKEELTWPHFWSTKKYSQHKEDYGSKFVIVLNGYQLSSFHFWVKTLPDCLKAHMKTPLRDGNRPIAESITKMGALSFCVKILSICMLVHSVSCVLLCSTSAVILRSTQIRSKQFPLHVVCNFSCALLSFE